jgi:hypothetical protein
MHLGVLYLNNLWVLFGRLFYRELRGGQLAILHKFFFPPRNLGGVCAHIQCRQVAVLRASAGMPDSPGDLLLASLVI